MKAVMVTGFGPVGDARLVETPDPVPGPGEVVVAVEAVEANYPDILVMEGSYQVKPPLPFSPGKAAAGRVVALGAGVTGIAVGTPVAVQVEYGAYAQQVVARADACFALPDGMPYDVAAALGLVYQTSHFALRERAGFRPGDRVLVLGAAGGIGSAAVQLARAMGAGRVMAGVIGPEAAQAARGIGCDDVIDLGMENLRDGLRAAVLEATGGHGADIVIDPVGGAANAAALRAMAWRGRMVIIGFASGEIPSIKANYLLVKNIAVSGLQWSDYRERTPDLVRAAQAEIFSLWQQGLLAPVISRRLPLAEFARGLEALRAGEVRGKLVLLPNG